MDLAPHLRGFAFFVANSFLRFGETLAALADRKKALG